MSGLSPLRRRELKARAHALKPVVLIGSAGLTPGALAEIERSLRAHELIKIRVAGFDRGAREEFLAQVCAQTGSDAVQHIGKVLVVFRENPEIAPRAAEPAREVGARLPKVRPARKRGHRPGVRPKTPTATRSERR